MDILFLDFDGVLHPVFPRTDRSHQENQHFSGCELLADVLDQQTPNIKIVVSSTWRLGKTIDQLKHLVGVRLGSRIIGATPNFNLRLPGIREAEARTWVEMWERNRPATEAVRWFALDDMPSLWYSHEKLMVTDDGFRHNEAESLKQYISILLDNVPSKEQSLIGSNSGSLDYDEADPADVGDFGH